MSAPLPTKWSEQDGAARRAAKRLSSPYVGLVPYSESDAEFFFGRVAESRNIAANLRGARLTLLYGPSGVGKSSVLRAGVVARLRDIARHDLTERGVPDFAVVFFNEWATDPLDSLARHIRESVKEALGRATIATLPPALSLRQIIKAWTERYGIELLIIFDQFEEYFLYHAGESGSGTFADELPEAVNSSDLHARFLISMRDDTLFKLDRFKDSIPSLFNNRLPVEHLSLAAAYEAVVEPVKKYNDLYSSDNPFTFDGEFDHKERAALLANALDESKPLLLNRILSEVQVGKLSIGFTGHGVVKREEEAGSGGGSMPKVSIEAPYLQLVMTHIWHDEDTVKSHALKVETLDKLGGSQKIVKRHLDEVMERLTEEEQDAAAAVFYHLVTPSGTKIAHTVNDLAEYTKLSEERIARLVESFLKVKEEKEELEGTDGKEEYRILRRVNLKHGEETLEAYEVYHDALAPAVLAWGAKHKSEQDKRRALEAEYKKQRLALFVAIVIVLLVVPTALFFYITQQNHLQKEEELRKAADSERNQARAGEELLISQKKSLETNRKTLQLLVALTGGAPEEKAAAVKTLQEMIESGQIEKELVPVIRPILLQLAESQQQTQTGKETAEAAAEAAKQITQQVQDTRISPRVYIQIQAKAQLDFAGRLRDRLNASQLTDIPNVRPRIIAPGIENLGPRRNIEVSELRYFHDTELEGQIGEQLVRILEAEGLTNVILKPIRGYENNPDIRPNHFELWLAPDVP